MLLRLASSVLLATALVLPGGGTAGADPTGPVTPALGLVDGGAEVTVQADDPVRFTQVATGDAHTLAVMTDGTVYAWGTGDSGQLGLGDMTQALEPTAIDREAFGGEDVVQVVAGSAHSVALTSGGAVYTWGANARGQLGLGSGVTGSAEPVLLASLAALVGSTVTQVDAGADFAVVLTGAGAVYAWGWGSLGQIGIGSTATQWDPVLVVETLDGVPVAQVAAGENSVVALTEHGAVYCWGNGGNGRLGRGSSGVSVWPVPVDTSGVLAGQTVEYVAIGTASVYAVTEDGSMVAWGSNANGELGTGASGAMENSVPLAVDLGALPDGARIVEVAATLSIALARDDQGRLYGWGSAGDGILAGGRDADRPEPLEYDGDALTGATALGIGPSAGSYDQRRAFAVTASGDILAWGTGQVGQLGLGAPADRVVETPHSLHTAMTEVRFGDVPAAQVRREGAVVHAVTPPHAAGTVDVHVRTGDSTITHDQAFTYGTAPRPLVLPVGEYGQADRQLELVAMLRSGSAVTIRWEVEGADGTWGPVDPDRTEQHDAVTGETVTTRLRVTAPDGTDQYRLTVTNPFGAWTSASIWVQGVACPTLTGEPHAAVAGEPYAFTFDTSSDTLATGVDPNGGALPDGLTLSTDGLLSGTPTTAGSYQFRVLAADPSAHAVCGSSAPALDVDLVVHEPVTLGGEPPAGEVGTAYAHTFTVGGTPAPELTIAEGTLPPGLELQADGTLTGVPTTAGEYRVGVVAANGVGASVRVDVVIRIDPAGAAGTGTGPGAGADEGVGADAGTGAGGADAGTGAGGADAGTGAGAAAVDAGTGTGAGLAATGADGLVPGALLAAGLLGVGGLMVVGRWRGTR
ncbi:putative Ig domain-containing protein [Cellulomonas denverensis]|uniref:RCC1-like domain-containing protein n=1 Tax=Cellulomonas denverensis TaxID=264297 RepID=A0A7X6R091_9CELL|nr:putative Ig domain-containing protein [Cellulomonas denverensis]NKY23950.1 hypothetical protein [Cellulomonas denverensis]GIG24928.1 hypothetical protein Cde04nite_11720 [Cellulomonas denverensis]